MSQTALRTFLRDLGSAWAPAPGHPRIEAHKRPGFPKDRWSFVLDFADHPERGITNRGEGSATSPTAALRELNRLIKTESILSPGPCVEVAS